MKEIVAPQNAESSSSYDDIPYPSHPFEATHPDHIYTMAKLFRLEPTLPDDASILELGCASGGNLIPLAVQMPRARIVGIDLSAKQIAVGQKTIDELGLTNIRLIAQDFQAIDESFGEFDYILCHGVFSWVPVAAQNRIFEICRDRLTPDGVAYISYNANPGWFMRGMIREMMLYHVSNITDPATKIKQARALLSFIVDSTEGQETPYAKILKGELDLLAKHPDSYLFHEHLEENNRPLFFYQFMEMARTFDLQFLGESSLSNMITSNLPAKASEALTKLTTDVHHRSQYTDFVTNRMFRQSLLCHKDRKLNRHLDQSSIEDGKFAGNFKLEDPAQANNLSTDIEVAFKCANGRGIQTSNVALKALVYTLIEAWPNSLSIQDISTRIEKKLSELLVVGGQELGSISTLVKVNMLQMLIRGDVEMRFIPDRFANQGGEKPKVTALSRLQAKSNGAITTQRHSMLNVDPLTRLVMQSFDGEKTMKELAEFLGNLVMQGKINISVKGDQPANMEAIHIATIEKVVEQLRRSAVLV